MSKTQKDALKALQNCIRIDPENTFPSEFEKEAYDTSDRSTAILLATTLETALEKLLMTLAGPDTRSDDLFEGEGALFSTFSTKIKACYHLKLIGKTTYNDLKLIRHLRNAFAHSRSSLAFNTPQVKAICDMLQLISLNTNICIPLAYTEVCRTTGRQPSFDIEDPRVRYIATCHSIGYRIFISLGNPDIISGDPELSKCPLP